MTVRVPPVLRAVAELGQHDRLPALPDPGRPDRVEEGPDVRGALPATVSIVELAGRRGGDGQHRKDQRRVVGVRHEPGSAAGRPTHGPGSPRASACSASVRIAPSAYCGAGCSGPIMLRNSASRASASSSRPCHTSSQARTIRRWARCWSGGSSSRARWIIRVARSHSPRAISGSAALPASMLPNERSRPMLRDTSMPASAISTASS